MRGNSEMCYSKSLERFWGVKKIKGLCLQQQVLLLSISMLTTMTVPTLILSFLSLTPPQLSSFHPCYLSVYSSAPSLAYSPDVELLGMCAVLTFLYALHEAFPDNILVVVRCVSVWMCVHHHCIMCDHLTRSVVSVWYWCLLIFLPHCYCPSSSSYPS